MDSIGESFVNDGKTPSESYQIQVIIEMFLVICGLCLVNIFVSYIRKYNIMKKRTRSVSDDLGDIELVSVNAF